MIYLSSFRDRDDSAEEADEVVVSKVKILALGTKEPAVIVSKRFDQGSLAVLQNLSYQVQRNVVFFIDSQSLSYSWMATVDERRCMVLVPNIFLGARNFRRRTAQNE